ncbi:hypothetical protein [Sediminispirochaeta bajacaliforniensis]|uniref:hypothetical protein n=1 Tax=Sediminispirochaeta bajacaliforniensis TaxID=148 RepID=UPI000367E184|nr:hypothetical protein [Sediminispirochaeta bajacaliforniensis]
MPALNESSFLQRIDTIKELLSNEDQQDSIIATLQEKGVECAILTPLFETLLGFDALRDIKYEYTSNKKFNRFDFLIDNRFIVEAKRLNSPLTSLHKQISEYIEYHDDIPYGMLSNGSEYAFFIQKSFIKEFLGPEEKLKINFKKNVFHVLSISIFDVYFLEVIKLFSKDQYHQYFSNIAKYALTRINNSRGTKICDDKEMNQYLQEKISETMDIRPGAYLKDIQDGKLKTGDTLVYEDECVKIPVTIENDGRVKLKKATVIVKDMMKIIDNEFSPLIDLVRTDWKNEDVVFNDTAEIIKIATGRERLRKGKYEFK